MQQFVIPWYHYYGKASQKARSQGYVQKNLSAKFYILKILIETWFIPPLDKRQLITLQDIEWSQYDTSFSEKNLFTVYFNKFHFAKFYILPLFLNTFFIHCKGIKQLKSYLKFKCYQRNGKVSHNYCYQNCFFKKLYNLLLLMLLIRP